MKNSVYVCDECGETKKFPKAPIPIYCPSCGERMRFVEDYKIS